jgi:cyclopropane fatty-acyl-phospholipid synthase-like methyltransferase
MHPTSSHPPYFERLFERLHNDDSEALAAFGRHVHWGCWHVPPTGPISAAEYGAAAEALCRELCDVARIADGQVVLDVGCGFGGTLASLNERFGRLRMIGANIDRRQLERATRNVLAVKENTIAWLHCDATSIPLADGGFDRVLAVECIFHFSRARFLAEAARLLRPNGNLTLSDFVPDERVVEYAGSLDLASDELIRRTYGAIDLSCSITGYQALAAQSGLRLAERRDLTRQTLPTYEFLRRTSTQWEDQQAAAMFQRATARLEKASRKGLLRYEILRFEIA